MFELQDRLSNRHPAYPLAMRVLVLAISTVFVTDLGSPGTVSALLLAGLSGAGMIWAVARYWTPALKAIAVTAVPR